MIGTGVEDVAVVLRALYLMDPFVNFDRSVHHDGILWDWRLANPELELCCTETNSKLLSQARLVEHLLKGHRISPLRVGKGREAKKGRNSGVKEKYCKFIKSE